MEIGHVIIPTRLQIDQEWCSPTNLVECVQGDGPCDRRVTIDDRHQMHHRVRRTSYGLKDCDGVDERLPTENILWFDLFLRAAHSNSSTLFCYSNPRRRNGCCACAFQWHQSKSCKDTCHGTSSSHNTTSPGRGCKLFAESRDLLDVDRTGSKLGPVVATVSASPDPSTLMRPRHHRSCHQLNDGLVGRNATHELSRRGFVAA